DSRPPQIRKVKARLRRSVGGRLQNGTATRFQLEGIASQGHARAQISPATGGRSRRPACPLRAGGAFARSERLSAHIAFAGGGIENSVRSSACSRPNSILARAASDAGNGRVRNGRPRPQRFRIRQKISARHAVDRSRAAEKKVGVDPSGVLHPTEEETK